MLERLRWLIAETREPARIDLGRTRAEPSPWLRRDDEATPQRPAVAQAPWDRGAIGLYQDQIHERLVGRHCESCGMRYSADSVYRTDGGITLDEHGLTTGAAASVLAWTQRLLLRCTACGTSAQV